VTVVGDSTTGLAEVAPLSGRDDDEVVGYVRSPSDVLRLVTYATATVVLLVVTRFAEDSVAGFERDVLDLVTFLPTAAERILAGVASVLVLVITIGVFVPPIVLKRYRLLGYEVLANAVAVALVGLAAAWLDRGAAPEIANRVADRAGVDVGEVLSARTMAQIVSSFVILAPFVSHRWRTTGVGLVVVLALMRLLLSADVPSELVLSLAIGAMVGSGTLLAFGRPDRRPTVAAVTTSLTRSGLAVASLERASVDARGSTPYIVHLGDGSTVFAKALSPEERAADLLFRAYRFLRLKNVGDERPFSSLRRTVEHEALVSLQARDVGVRTPRLRAIAGVGDDSMLLAYDLVDGRSLEWVDPEAVDDDLLRGVWEQVAVLRRHRIAHRDLRRANIFVDADGAPWLIDFGFSEVAASDDLLAADVAQLLAALTVAVGPERAVTSAIAVIGAEAVGGSLRFLQPNALSGATRTALRAQKGLLDELQQTVADRCGIDQPEFAPLDRISGKTIFTIVMLAAVTYFLLPQLADVPGIIERVEEANWAWFPAVLAMSALTYVGATLSLTGAVPQRLRAIPTFLTQIGSSFASKLAPAGLGGMALNTRMLQKAGVDPAVAVSSVGLNTGAGFATHVVLLVVFAVWAGRSVLDSVRLPDPHVLLYGLAAVAVLAGGSLAVPTVRRQLRERLWPLLRRSLSGFGAVFRHPDKVLMLFGGSAVVSVSYVVALFFSIQAFGGGLSFAQVGAIYFAGSAVASVAPTPGGLGALEAAVIAGLVAAGMENTVAVPSVFMFRLATFWIPILPGWAAFTYLRRSDDI
jgi:undecaprenyl-diphosphatase